MIHINQSVATQIVDAISQVVDKDINFINREGIIIASTKGERVGTFHEVGYQVAKTGEMQMVTHGTTYEGTKEGVNYPIIIEQQVVGVIGITGEPQQVMQFGFLASKITEIFIKEHQIEDHFASRKKLCQYLMNKCLYERELNLGEIEKLLERLHISETELYCCMRIELNKKCVDVMQVEAKIVDVMQQYQVDMYLYQYPMRFIIFLPEKRLKAFQEVLRKGEGFDQGGLSCGIGGKYPMREMLKSYEEAGTALKYAIQSGERVKESADMDIEMLLEGVTTKVKQQYIHKVTGGLTREECQLLEIYYTYNMSLKEVADALRIHKNTVQYRLDKITEKTGFNPRQVKESMRLYLALYLKNIL